MCLAVPRQIVEIPDGATETGVVDIDGEPRRISLALLADDGDAPPRVGDWVLVHVGYAMARVEASEAAELLAQLRSLGELTPEWG
jgi:hydrogenase expression/formation protein HypC